MADLILNEWVWSNLIDNSTERFRDETYSLIQKIFVGPDRLIMVRPSPSFKKAYNLCKYNQMPQRGFAKYIVLNFLLNSTKCLFLPVEDLNPLPNELQKVVKDDDRYLVQAIITVPNSILVSTDGPLLIDLKKNGISCVHRDNFIKEY